jgi:ParB family chromosome partitioning protein
MEITETPVTGHEAPVTIQHIPLAQLRESPLNARKHFDAAKLKELADSIREKGILTPLLVRKRRYELASKAATEPDMTYEILAGARRFRAAQLVEASDPRLAKILGEGKRGDYEVPCIVRDVDDTTALEIITMENLQREDLSALEEAQGFRKLLDLGKYDVAQLAKRLGKSQSYVYQRVKLVDLAPDAAKALLEQKITPGHAILIARLQPQDQARALKESLPTKHDPGRSVRELGEFIQEEIHLDLTKAPWKLDDAALLPPARATACNVCPKRDKNACLDPACYEAKLGAHIKQIEKRADSRLVKISAEYQTHELGILDMRKWHFAQAKSCPDATIGLVMDSGWANGRELKRGQQVGVCVNHLCKVHWKKEERESGSPYQRPAAERARERKLRALEAARIEALRQIVADVRSADIEQVAVKLCERTTYDAQKLACKALGIGPPGKKIGGFDFRKKLAARMAEAKSGTIGMVQVLTALALAPSFGRWGNEFFSGKEEIAALHRAGKAAGVNVAKIEASFVSAAAEKAKGKAKPPAKPKVHMSAKSKPKPKAKPARKAKKP